MVALKQLQAVPPLEENPELWQRVREIIQVIAESEGSAPTNFLQLTDTPASYSGEANKFVQVSATEDRLVFSLISGGEANTTVNRGGGFELALAKEGVVLPFRTLFGNSPIEMAELNDVVYSNLNINGQTAKTPADVTDNLLIQQSDSSFRSTPFPLTVVDITIPDTGWPYTLANAAITPDSLITFQALNLSGASVGSGLYVGNQIAGSVDIDYFGRIGSTFPTEFGAGLMGTENQGWAWGGSENWSSLDFDEIIGTFQFIADTTANRLICDVPSGQESIYGVSLTVSGQAKEDSEFMFAVSLHEEGTDPSAPQDGIGYVIIPNKSGVSDPDVGVTIYSSAAMNQNDFLMGWKWAKDTGSGGSNDYGAVLSAVPVFRAPPSLHNGPTQVRVMIAN